MSESEYPQEPESPEAAAVEEARRQLDEPVDRMKAAILKLSRESNIIEHGLTEERPVDDEPDPELVELGKKRYEQRKAQQAAEPPPLSDEARELLEEATTLELEGGYGEIEKGLRHAERDRQGFLDWARAAIDADPQVAEVLETYGAEDLADLVENSDTFRELDEEEQQAVLEEVGSSPALAYVEQVLSQRRAEDLADKSHELQQTARHAAETDDALWGAKISRALGGQGLDEAGWEGAQDEISGFQDGLRAAGPALMEQLVDGFDASNIVHLDLFEQLVQPLEERAGDDIDLGPVAQILGRLVSEMARETTGRKHGEEILRAAGNSLPLIDSDRNSYVEEWLGIHPKPVVTMQDLKTMLRAGPAPNRTGKQVGRDLRKENLSVRDELERARNKHDKAYGKELARRRAGQFPGR
jgi:hypothetical protein